MIRAMPTAWRQPTLSPKKNAALSGTAMRVTPSALSQKGAVYYNVPLSVVYGFETTFTFKITSLVGGGGDGFFKPVCGGLY